MNLDHALAAFARADAVLVDAIEWVLATWDSSGPACRALLTSYVAGEDLSEQTEQAMFIVVLLLGETGDTGSFPALCALAQDRERCNSVFDADGKAGVLPAVLISTFDGNASALQHLIDRPFAEDGVRADVLLALAYLTRTRRFPEAAMYDYLAARPGQLGTAGSPTLWFGWARAVAALGFAGLSGAVMRAFREGRINRRLMDAASFQAELREAQEDPHGTTSSAWDSIGPAGSAIALLQSWIEDQEGEAVAAPARNPLRTVGRNDPCPCGSGRKYKKCCLPA